MGKLGCLNHISGKSGFMYLLSLLLLSGLFITLLFGMLLLTSPALAHVPEFEEEGRALEEAIPIENPAKSRVLYGRLGSGGDIRYYSFEAERGERILLSLIIPAPAPEGFVPELVLLGPEIPVPETPPETLEIPEGYGAKILPGQLLEKATYEGFTPGAFYSLASLDQRVPKSGTYYAVVHSPAGEGNYGLVLGYLESFSISEWLLVPLGQFRIYRWQGQSTPFILAPLALTLLTGYLELRRRKKLSAPLNPTLITGTFAALFFFGTGVSFIFQMLLALSRASFTPGVFLTLFLAITHFGLGDATLSLTLKNRKMGPFFRLYFIGLGLAGLFLWAGWFVGPALAIVTGLGPGREKEKQIK